MASRRERRWTPAAREAPLFAAFTERYTPGVAGAFVEAKDLPKQGNDDDQNHLVGVPFDLTNFLTIAAGTTQTLIGSGAAKQVGRVPTGRRALLYAICPYLEAASGPVTQARIPGVGVDVTWRILVDGTPQEPYHNIKGIIMPFGTVSPVPLLEIPAERVLSCDVKVTDPNAVYQFVGIRIVMRWVPWAREWR